MNRTVNMFDLFYFRMMVQLWLTMWLWKTLDACIILKHW